jgi:molybdopterin molybdotransferase
MLKALLARDGALVEPIPTKHADLSGLQTALSDSRIASCQSVLIAGRSGGGFDDAAALAVIAVGGTLSHHGIALRPGHTAGMGVLPRRLRCCEAANEVPVILLPGEPFACLIAYDLLAARLVRPIAGGNAALPYRAEDFLLERKIASGIGSVEVVPVQLVDGRARPLGTDAGLVGAVRADGFVVISEESEGYPAGGRVRVHLYDRIPTGMAAERLP